MWFDLNVNHNTIQRELYIMCAANQIDIKLLNIMIMNQKVEKYCVESHKGLY